VRPASHGMQTDAGDLRLPPYLETLPTDRRGLPALVSVARQAGEVLFASLSEPRKLALATFGLCGICGLPFGPGELRWLAMPPTYDPSEGATNSGEAPVHRVCLLSAIQLCPWLAKPQMTPRHVRGVAPKVADRVAAGFRQVEALITQPPPFPAAGQPSRTLIFCMPPAVEHFSWRAPEDLAEERSRPAPRMPSAPELGPLDPIVRKLREVVDSDGGNTDPADRLLFPLLYAGGALIPGIWETIRARPEHVAECRYVAGRFLDGQLTELPGPYGPEVTAALRGRPPLWAQSVVARASAGRNDRCPCGSGSKWKYCCGR
jgi:hypothetical protein